MSRVHRDKFNIEVKSSLNQLAQFFPRHELNIDATRLPKARRLFIKVNKLGQQARTQVETKEQGRIRTDTISSYVRNTYPQLHFHL